MKRQILTVCFILCLFATSFLSFSVTNAQGPLRLKGVDIWDLNNTQDSIQALATYDANTLRLQVYMSQWNTPALQAKIIAIDGWADAVGLNVIVACMGTEWNPSEGWNQMKANAVYDAANKTVWLATYGDVIDTLQPFGVNCMNEPPELTDTTYSATSESQFRIDYKNWVLDCITAFTAYKSNLVFVVENAPFFNVTGVLDAPRIDTSTSSIIYYSMHYHYSYSNTDPYTWGWVDAPQRAYWSAITQEDLDDAKALLYYDLLTDRGMQELVNAGVNVCMDEVGGNILNPNMLVYLQDMFDFASTYDFGILIHHWGYPDDNSLTTNYAPTLNVMGEVWATNMADPEPTPTPTPTASPTPSLTATPSPTPSLTASPTPTASPVQSQAQIATNQVFTNMYLALGIVVVSTLIAGCYVIISSFNSGSGNARFGVGLVLISIVEVVIGVVIVSAFQGSMGTVAISLLSIKGIT